MNRDTVTAGAAGTGVAQEMWDALRRARAEQTPRTLAQLEDALFRHYLPMARTMAIDHTVDTADPEAVGQAAEVGLAQAILAWRQRDSAGFDRYAQATISAQLRRHRDLLTGPARRPTTRRAPPVDPTLPPAPFRA